MIYRIPIQPENLQMRIWRVITIPYAEIDRCRKNRLSVSQIAKTDIPVSIAIKTDKSCDYCHKPIPQGKREDAKYCSDVCRKARWRDDQRLTGQIDDLMRQLDNLLQHSPERFNAIMQRYRHIQQLPSSTDISVSTATKTDNRLPNRRDGYKVYGISKIARERGFE